MAVFNEPTKWQTSLVNSGDANVIPQSTPVGTGEASFEDGFPQITQVPISAGGIAPDRKDFNGLFKVLGDWIFFNQNGGVPSYNADYDYIAGRVVSYNGNIYKCIQANGASSTVVAPDSNDTYWQQLDGENTSTSLIPNQTIISELPLTDANLHLKDGAVLSGSGAYSAYVNLISNLYKGGTASSSFCSEVEWQTSNTNYGFCNKFVYDPVANTVRLPKINSLHGALIKSSQSGNDWYRIYQDGWCEQGSRVSAPHVNEGFSVVVTLPVAFRNASYYCNWISADGELTLGEGTRGVRTTSNSTITIYNGQDIDMIANWFACGYTDLTDLQASPIYEYIVIGTVSKTDIQIDIDQVMTDLALKADKDLTNAILTSAFATAMNSANIRTVVETYVNGASWYRVWSDGWCEQGTYIYQTSVSSDYTLLKPYRDTNYTVVASTSISSAVSVVITSNSTISIMFQAGGQLGAGFYLACGYIS